MTRQVRVALKDEVLRTGAGECVLLERSKVGSCVEMIAHSTSLQWAEGSAVYQRKATVTGRSSHWSFPWIARILKIVLAWAAAAADDVFLRRPTTSWV